MSHSNDPYLEPIMIDIIEYREQKARLLLQNQTRAEDLGNAIQNLIQRLREGTDTPTSQIDQEIKC